MRKLFRTILLFFVVSLALLGCVPIAPPALPATTVENGEFTVAAAADLQFAFADIAALFEQQTGQKVTLVFGSTGQLAQQIESGAPFDLYAAANIAFVNQLAAKNLVIPETVALYARGRIVLAVNKESGRAAVALDDLRNPEIRQIAIANPEHAPYGLAAKEALQTVGIWEQLQEKLVLGENVRQTLQYIQTGDAEVGIVALSVAAVPEITWTLLDESLHNPLDQALAVVASSPHAALAREFALFINGETGRPIMRKYGFILPGEDPVMPTPAAP